MPKECRPTRSASAISSSRCSIRSAGPITRPVVGSVTVETKLSTPRCMGPSRDGSDRSVHRSTGAGEAPGARSSGPGPGPGPGMCSFPRAAPPERVHSSGPPTTPGEPAPWTSRCCSAPGPSLADARGARRSACCSPAPRWSRRWGPRPPPSPARPSPSRRRPRRPPPRCRRRRPGCRPASRTWPRTSPRTRATRTPSPGPPSSATCWWRPTPPPATASTGPAAPTRARPASTTTAAPSTGW